MKAKSVSQTSKFSFLFCENSLESALEILTIQYENLKSSKSIITDANVEIENSDFIQQSILQQVSKSFLVKAKQPSAAV